MIGSRHMWPDGTRHSPVEDTLHQEDSVFWLVSLQKILGHVVRLHTSIFPLEGCSPQVCPVRRTAR